MIYLKAIDIKQEFFVAINKQTENEKKTYNLDVDIDLSKKNEIEIIKPFTKIDTVTVNKVFYPDYVKFGYSNITDDDFEIILSRIKDKKDWNRAFSNCSKLYQLINYKTPYFIQLQGEDFGNCFNACTRLAAAQITFTGAIYTSKMFFGCTNLQSLELRNCGTITDMGSLAEGCTRLYEVNIDDCSGLTVRSEGMLSKCSSLEYIFGFKNYGSDLIQQPIRFNLSAARNLDISSFKEFLENIADCNNISYQRTIRLHRNVYSQLTDEIKELAASKGWSLQNG